jgi:hypothetical protein
VNAFRDEDGLVSGKELAMIEHSLDTAHSILYVQPKSALEQEDFAQLASTVDPYLEATGDLAGLIIETHAFPGWDSWARWPRTSASCGIITSASEGRRRDRRRAGQSRGEAGVTLHVSDDQALSGRVEAAKQWIMSKTPVS